MTPAARRDEHGLVLPSWLVAVCAVVVALAVVGFAVSGDRDPEVTADGSNQQASAGATRGGAEPDSQETGSAGPDRRPQGAKADEPEGDPEREEPAERRTAYVEVYNNSGITGLAAGAAATLQDTGWRVVTTDNWYGEIPTDSVYYPASLAGQAELLAGDLGIDRVQRAVEPMSFDRLTVILVTGA
ncbi:MAG: LytR C-terminal domain-containing protein [Actinomycetota bacterium]|nr:LytR C-terminal domain-containing protein [Actinomycetota bacterium]